MGIAWALVMVANGDIFREQCFREKAADIGFVKVWGFYTGGNTYACWHDAAHARLQA